MQAILTDANRLSIFGKAEMVFFDKIPRADFLTAKQSVPN